MFPLFDLMGEILSRTDAELSEHLSSRGLTLHFTLAWVLTFFSHSIAEMNNLTWLFDVMLVEAVRGNFCRGAEAWVRANESAAEWRRAAEGGGGVREGSTAEGAAGAAERAGAGGESSQVVDGWLGGCRRRARCGKREQAATGKGNTPRALSDDDHVVGGDSLTGFSRTAAFSEGAAAVTPDRDVDDAPPGSLLTLVRQPPSENDSTPSSDNHLPPGAAGPRPTTPPSSSDNDQRRASLLRAANGYHTVLYFIVALLILERKEILVLEDACEVHMRFSSASFSFASVPVRRWCEKTRELIEAHDLEEIRKVVEARRERDRAAAGGPPAQSGWTVFDKMKKTVGWPVHKAREGIQNAVFAVKWELMLAKRGRRRSIAKLGLWAGGAVGVVAVCVGVVLRGGGMISGGALWSWGGPSWELWSGGERSSYYDAGIGRAVGWWQSLGSREEENGWWGR